VHDDPGPPPPPHIVRTPIESNPAADPTPVIESLPKALSESERISNVNAALEDAYFAYDRSDLSDDALAALRHDADLLCAIFAEFPGLKVTLEGHCDERGSAEYNLALGDHRARRAEEMLAEHGVPRTAIEVVSYGKENPQCLEATEDCRQRNRRAHISVGR
jgi:peptidoglycan-associated lipoprotein